MVYDKCNNGNICPTFPFNLIVFTATLRGQDPSSALAPFRSHLEKNIEPYATSIIWRKKKGKERHVPVDLAVSSLAYKLALLVEGDLVLPVRFLLLLLPSHVFASVSLTIAQDTK